VRLIIQKFSPSDPPSVSFLGETLSKQIQLNYTRPNSTDISLISSEKRGESCSYQTPSNFSWMIGSRLSWEPALIWFHAWWISDSFFKDQKEMPNHSKVVFEGWLVRYGKRTLGRSYFHMRYFVLEPNLLSYYKRKPKDNMVRKKFSLCGFSQYHKSYYLQFYASTSIWPSIYLVWPYFSVYCLLNFKIM
jgi:hypothetical protein